MRAATASTAALAAISLIAASAPASAGTSAPDTVRLSDERTVTQSASAVAAARAYEEPASSARAIGRLRLVTDDGFPEVYLLLESRRDAAGAEWIHLRIPQRPNGMTGWVPRRALGPFDAVHTRLVVDRAARRVTLYDHGVRRFRAPVGIGARGTPTPAGSFWIREKFRVTHDPLYGTRAIGTSAYSDVLTDWPGGGVIGLHGTSEPSLIPGRPSHGCIRMRNRAIERLYRLTPIGTPLLIR